MGDITYNATYPNENTFDISETLGLIKDKCEQIRTEQIVDAGTLQGYTAAQLLNSSGGTPTTNTVIQQNQQGSNAVKSYVATVYPQNNGSVSNSSVNVARFNLNGVGFEQGSPIASSKMRVTIKSLDKCTTTEFLVSRSGSKYRIDYQAYLYGGLEPTEYWAQSRGSMMLPQGVLNSPGWCGWKNTFTTSKSGRHNHMAVNNSHDGLPSNDNPSSAVEPLYYNGTPYYGRTGNEDTAQTIVQLAIDGEHLHNVSIETPLKISTASAVGDNHAMDSSIDNAVETGTTTTRKLNPVIYADGTTAVSNYYTQYTANNFLELRIENIPVQTGWSPIVEVVIEFLGDNHTIWFWNADTSQWNIKRVVGVLGDSIVEGVELADKIYFNTASSPYGGVYKYTWTERLGFYNYGIGGQTTDQIKTRLSLSGNDIALNDGSNTETKGFTDIIVDGGVNDCIKSVLYSHNMKFSSDSYDVSWTFKPLQNIKDMIAIIQTATARTINPIILICPPINAAMYFNNGGSSLSISDFNNTSTTTMPLSYLQEIAALWVKTKNEIIEYCQSNSVGYIDWFTPMLGINGYKIADSHDGIHPNTNGYYKLSSYIDIE